MAKVEGEVTISIDKPADGDQVPAQVNVIGTSKGDYRACRYVFLIAHDISAPGKSWKIADLVQVDTTGDWAGKVKLDKFPLGTEIEIDARISAQPKTYVVDQLLSTPPDEGVPSNIVQIRRIQ